jgi:hypothetical protein
MHRGSGSEVAEYLKSGAADLAIAAVPSGNPGCALMSYCRLRKLSVLASAELTD